MPRGRPRKNPLPDENKKSSPDNLQNLIPDPQNLPAGGFNDAGGEVTPPKEKTAQSAKKEGSKEKDYPKCDRCGGDIVTSAPYIIDPMRLTGLAAYHTENVPMKFNICVQCAHECCKVLEDWYFSGRGENAKGRFCDGKYDIKKQLESM